MTEVQTLPQAAPADGPSLSARVVRGAAWVFLGKLLGRGMQLARLVVLARLLAPEDFGLFGIVMLAIVTVDTFTQTGFSTALIQRRGDTASHLDTAWTVGLVRGLALAGIIYAGAPLVGAFFGEPRAVPLLRVTGIGVALAGFTNIGTVYFQKELQFHRQVLWETASAFVGLVVGVVLAYRLRSVWALVWAGLAARLVTCLLSYAIHPYRPRLRFSASRARELHRFGRWVLISSIMILIIRQGDVAAVGKLLGAAALGIYQMAYRISNMAATEITFTISAVAMPAYAKIQDDVPRLRSWYFKVLSGTLLIAAPLAAGTAAVAPMFVAVVLGPRWTAALAPIQLLCVFGLLRAMAATAGPVFYGSGNPKCQTLSTGLEAACMVALIWPATTRWGLAGTCLAVTVAICVALFYAAGRLARILDLRRRDLARCVAGSVLPACVMFGFVSGLGRVLAPGVLGLAAMVLAGIATYGGLLALLAVSPGGRQTTGAGTRQMLRSLWTAARGMFRRSRTRAPRLETEAI